MKKLPLILASLWLSIAPAAAQTLVPNLGAAGAVSDTDLMAIYQGTSPLKKVTGAQLKTYTNGTGIRATTTITESVLNTDQNKLVTFNNASPVAVSIAQAGSGGLFNSTYAVSLKNLGAGTVTLTPATSTIDNAATLVLTTGQGVDLYSDGTNYFTQPGKGGTTTDASLLTSGTLAAARLPALTGDCTAAVGTGATVCAYPHPGLVAGQWYVPSNMLTLQNGQAALINTIACTWAVVPQKVTISRLGARIVTAGTTNFQMALYTNASGKPGTLLSNTGNIVTTATGAVSGAFGANKQVGPGGSDGGMNVWLCMNIGDSTTIFQAVGTVSLVGAIAFGDATLGNILQGAGNSVTHLYCQGASCNGGSSTFNTWPASLAGSTWTRGGAPNSGVVMPVIAYNPVSVP